MPKKIHKQKPELPFPCTSCKREFMTLEGVTNNKDKKHSRKRPYKYQSCDKTFLTTANLTLCYNSHWRETVCMYFLWQEISQICHRSEHLRFHTGEKPQVSKVWHGVCWPWCTNKSCKDTQKRPNIFYMKKNYEESGTSESSSDSQWHKAT